MSLRPLARNQALSAFWLTSPNMEVGKHLAIALPLSTSISRVPAKLLLGQAIPYAFLKLGIRVSFVGQGLPVLLLNRSRQIGNQSFIVAMTGGGAMLASVGILSINGLKPTRLEGPKPVDR